MVRKGRGTWKLRAIPLRARWYAGSEEMSCPSNWIEPPSLRRRPDTQLMSVVLPEPFGPIRPKRSPCATSRLTSVSAAKPPKLFDSAWMLRSALIEGSFAREEFAVEAEDAVGCRDDEDDEQHADQQHVDLVRDGHGDDLLQRREKRGADHRAQPVRRAADHRARQRADRVVEIEGDRSEEHTSELQSQSNIVCR